MPHQAQPQPTSWVNGPMPVAPNTSLWRYVSLPVLLLYLEGRVRLSSVRELRRMDSNEGVLQWDHITHADAFSATEYGQLSDYVKSQMSPQELTLFDLNKDYPGANQQVLFNRWHKLLIATRYALCFFESTHESIAMWREFAPKGVAIRTSLNSLEAALQGTNRAWRMSKMLYWDKSRKITPDDTHNDKRLMEILRHPHLLKRREYEYEKEVRLCTVDPAERAHLLLNSVPPEAWIQEIRISPDIWHKDTEILVSLIAHRCPDLKTIISTSPLTPTPSIEDNFEEQIESDMAKDRAETWPPFFRNP